MQRVVSSTIHSRHQQKGDTLVEVLLAMAILSVVAVMTISLMNRGLLLTQNSIERSQVRAYMEGQLASLRYFRDKSMLPGGSVEWTKVLANGVSGSPTALVSDTTCKPDAAVMPKPFYIQAVVAPTGSLTVKPYDPNISTPASIATPGNWLWIEAYNVNQAATSAKAIDFVIRACWYPKGNGPIQSETMTVRLYDGQ